MMYTNPWYSNNEASRNKRVSGTTYMISWFFTKFSNEICLLYSWEIMGEHFVDQMTGAYTALKLRITWPLVYWSLAVIIPTWLTYTLFIKPFLSPLRAVSIMCFLFYFNQMLLTWLQFKGHICWATNNLLSKLALNDRTCWRWYESRVGQ